MKDEYQKQKIGSRLLKEAESIAKTKEAIKSMLDTFLFQAKDFYIKNGYKVFGEVKDFPKGNSRFYLVKDLK